MKLITGIVALAMTAGTAWAQSPNIIQNTKNALQGAQQQQAAASNAAVQGTAAPTPSKPSPATASKPGTTPAKPAATPAPVAVKPAVATPAPKPVAKVVPAKAAATPAPVAVKPAVSQAPKVAPKVVPAKTATVPAKPQVAPAAAPKVAAAPKPASAPAASQPAPAAAASAKATAPAPKSEKPEEKKWSMTGKRDPFLSPVVNRQGGSGCSTGKKCLDIDQIAVRGVVKSDNGMIAVVTNGLNKAYFLRENDPVFNGYVVKITVDSVVFKQNAQDRLGKPFTKEVVKRITTPAV
jgi:hypothetical protein